MNIYIPDRHLENLRFIIFQFINTHDCEPEMYKKEIEIATKILLKLEKTMAQKGAI